MNARWEPGTVIRRREVLGLGMGEHPEPAPTWHGDCWIEWPVHVVEHTDDHLVTFTAPGARFAFPEGNWPIAGGRHPWEHNEVWNGHGCLMVQATGDDHAIWHFWHGADRAFACWYVNLQSAFVLTDAGYDTQDLELDIVVRPDLTYEVKDDELMDLRVEEGRFTADAVGDIRRLGAGLTDRLDAGDLWWDTTWADWTPDPTWHW